MWLCQLHVTKTYDEYEVNPSNWLYKDMQEYDIIPHLSG
jgi:hypothetical protein